MRPLFSREAFFWLVFNQYYINPPTGLETTPKMLNRNKGFKIGLILKVAQLSLRKYFNGSREINEKS